MTYGYVYVAQVAMGANHNQYLNAIKEAEAYDGPSLIIAYAPCINHGIKGGMGKSQLTEKEAVECGYWHLWRFNPALEAQGKNPFSLDSKEPDWSKFQQFIHSEVRYTSLLKSFPDEAKELFAASGKERAVALRDLQALRRDGLLGYGRGEVVRTTILFLPGRVRKRRAPVSFPAEETVSPDSRRSRSGDRHVSRFSSHTTDSVVRERSQGAYSPPESYCNIKILNPNATRPEAPAPKSGAGDRRTGFPSCRTDQKTGGPRQAEFFCRFIAPVD